MTTTTAPPPMNVVMNITNRVSNVLREPNATSQGRHYLAGIGDHLFTLSGRPVSMAELDTMVSNFADRGMRVCILDTTGEIFPAKLPAEEPPMTPDHLVLLKLHDTAMQNDSKRVFRDLPSLGARVYFKVHHTYYLDIGLLKPDRYPTKDEWGKVTQMIEALRIVLPSLYTFGRSVRERRYFLYRNNLMIARWR